jgi:glucan 1,3-beta-glucosidase
MWKQEMAAGMVLCILIFAVAMWTARRRPWAPRFGTWLGVAGSATAAGALLGVAVEKMLTESLGIGGWTQWGLLLAAGIAAPLLSASAQLSGRPLPSFLDMIGPRQGRTTSRRGLLLGLTLGVTTVIAVETALGLVFDPRYKDFPFAALTMAVVPFWMLMVFNRPRSGARPIAEAVFGGLLVIASAYIAFNEGIANWQALWTCLVYVMLGITLWRARAAQSPG